jgi:ABC-type branched-subunit amino acid transport system ATPase component
VTAAPLLTVEHLTMRFGGLVAVNDLSFTARTREITALIGPNGAGKTTLFNCITGFYRPTVGRLRLAHPDGASYLLERLPGFRIAKEARVARTFQNVRLFAGMTLLENLLVAQHNTLMLASGFTLLGLFGAPSYTRAQERAIDKARYWLASGSRGAPTIRPARCPTARNAASKSRAPCAPIRYCFASTSRPPASTTTRAPISIVCCARSATSTAPRFS